MPPSRLFRSPTPQLHAIFAASVFVALSPECLAASQPSAQQMALGWDSYIVSIDDQYASIVVDLDPPTKEVVEGLPYLLVVRTPLRAAGEQGLPTDEESERLNPLERQLDKAFASLGAHVGRYAYDGERIYFVYVATDQPDVTEVRSVMREHGYEPEMWTEPDVGWPRYFSWMYPSALDLRRILDWRVIDRLSQHGDDLQTAREVSHWIYFPTTEERSSFLNDLQAAGYQSESLGSESPFGVRVVTHQAVDINSIAAVVDDLTEHAVRSGGRYDGWETVVVRPARS